MKNILVTLIIITTLLFAGNDMVSAQPKGESGNKSAINKGAVKAVDLQNYEAFKQSIKPLIEKMGTKQIIGLGEGTHGTSEFYKLRYWINRILVEEKGFNHIAFENDFSDCWLLNNKLNTGANLDSLMKKYMLSIWQNTETKELLSWVREYNSTHDKKVIIDGLDYVFADPDLEVVKQLLEKTPAANLLDSISTIEKAAKYQDEGWIALNKPDTKYDAEGISKGAYSGYLAAEKLDSKIVTADLPAKVKADCHLALLNVEQAFAPYYDEATKKPEASRDSIMAFNASLIMKEPGAKMIIWAHDVHLAKKGIYNDEVGGTGGIILKMFPNNYFVLGTGTANGTFAATKEPRDTYTNPMAAYPLEQPVKDSWEELFSSVTSPAFYFEPATFNPGKLTKQMRFIGYGPDSGPKSYDATNVVDLYDAFLFVKETKAATPLK